ncbi:MAG: hypothetical protein M5U26_21650 [Planctomycetota bacterium]|nr:hypothetical protein [Planctomycetota bacterium]
MSRFKRNSPKHPTRTLFDPNWRQHHASFACATYLYSDGIRHLAQAVDARFHDGELEAFADIFESETYLDANAEVIGPLEWCAHGKPRQWLGKKRGKPQQLPVWVEPDGLKLFGTGAQGVLCVEKASIALRLNRARAWERLNLIQVCSSGVPRARARRFLHRLSDEFKLPVYVLADNDLWGYFIFSVLKRGRLNPGACLPQLATQDVRFLGVRAGEASRCLRVESARVTSSWQKRWDLRLKFMREYPCFRSKAWQREFDAFKRQGGKVEVEAITGILSAKGIADDYLAPKLQARDWLV